jgi:hypothetical protein
VNLCKEGLRNGWVRRRGLPSAVLAAHLIEDFLVPFRMLAGVVDEAADGFPASGRPNRCTISSRNCIFALSSSIGYGLTSFGIYTPSP